MNVWKRRECKKTMLTSIHGIIYAFMKVYFLLVILDQYSNYSLILGIFTLTNCQLLSHLSINIISITK